MGVLTFLRDSDLISSGNMPEVELLDLLATFCFEEAPCHVSQRLSQFKSPLQRARVPFSLHPYRHLSSLAFFPAAILTGMRLYFIVGLVSLMVSDAGHFSPVGHLCGETILSEVMAR